MSAELASAIAELTAAISASEAVQKRRDKALAEFLYNEQSIDIEVERSSQAMHRARATLHALEGKT